VVKILVLGGGAIGTTTAYFLSSQGADVTVVERTGIACAASGKSGGFLALDWCDGTPLAPLARRSFALHASLADGLEGDWFYRRMTTFGGALGRVRMRGPRHLGLPWLAPDVQVSGQLGSDSTTAQVHPAAYTRGMMRAAERHGATLRVGTATGLRRAGDRITGAEVDGELVEADAVVIAMGPWSILAAQWIPLPPVFGLKGHSLIFDVGTAVPPEAVFLEVEDGGDMLSPELFPRADGTAYVCAISSETALPVDPAAVGPDTGAIERLKALCSRISPVLAAAPILASGACYRPVTRDGLPLIGAVPGLRGAYVATGHSVWGILNAPATGEAIAGLILGRGADEVDLAAFDPARLPALDPAALSVSTRTLA
jgi:glycine/D-amino acid oxidase-like deaminating enzyme